MTKRTAMIYKTKGHKRSELIAEAVEAGLKHIGEKVVVRNCEDYDGIEGDYSVHYGLSGNLHRIFNDYRESSTAIYFDLGYWQRRIKTRFDGYHKISVNSRHPTEYFQRFRHPYDRFQQLGVEIKPWKKNPNGKILVAGISQKAAIAEGIPPFDWETRAINKLKAHTKREIVYRPKPNCLRSRPITGSVFDKKMPLQIALIHAHAAVTRHSNVAVDAILAGVPAFCDYGVAVPMSRQDLTKIESPYFPEDREQWAADIAYCQWTPGEISLGLPFKLLKDEGVIPV